MTEQRDLYALSDGRTRSGEQRMLGLRVMTASEMREANHHLRVGSDSRLWWELAEPATQEKGRRG